MTAGLLQGVRVFMVDDHPAVREGLQLLLARYGINVCGEAADSTGALTGIAANQTDLALVDLSLGSDSGLELLAQLKPVGVRTLVYTMHDDPRQIRAALTAGADGYVTKRELTDTLREAITTIISGVTYLSPVAAAALQADSLHDDTQQRLERLSPREMDIFRRVGRGDSTTDIAAELQISVSTVETNFTRIISKLELSGAKEMRRLAIHQRSL